MRAAAAFLFGCALACAGCGDEIETPTSASTTTTTASTRIFSGVIPVKGTKFYSYTVSTAGTVSAMLASLTTGTGVVAAHSMELGIGIPAGTGCAVREVIYAPPSLLPQLTQEAAAGVYCVSIADVDGLPASMNFAIRIVHP
jgi:hypothetical protein